MSKLQAALAGLGKDSQRPALMTHVVLGYPDLETSLALVRTMAQSGAKFIELQIPFSDPMADGPSIMRASEVALEQGVTPKDCFLAMEKLSGEISVPLIFMSYYNIVFARGVREFIRDAKNSGCEALIIPDIPIEETGDGFFEECKNQSLPAVPLVSPVTPENRLKAISKETSKEGFVYCVSTTGTTGARESLPPELESYLAKVKTHFNQALALGFGISKPEHVESLSGHAEIAVCGSAVINEINQALKNKTDPLKGVGSFVSKLSGV